MAFLKQFISLSLIFSIAHSSIAFAGRHGHTSDDEQGGGSSSTVVSKKVTSTTKKDSSSSDESLGGSPKTSPRTSPKLARLVSKKDSGGRSDAIHSDNEVGVFLFERDSEPKTIDPGSYTSFSDGIPPEDRKDSLSQSPERQGLDSLTTNSSSIGTPSDEGIDPKSSPPSSSDERLASSAKSPSRLESISSPQSGGLRMAPMARDTLEERRKEPVVLRTDGNSDRVSRKRDSEELVFVRREHSRGSSLLEEDMWGPMGSGVFSHDRRYDTDEEDVPALLGERHAEMLGILEEQPIQITPELVKRAWKGDVNATKRVGLWLRQHQPPSLQKAHDYMYVFTGKGMIELVAVQDHHRDSMGLSVGSIQGETSSVMREDTALLIGGYSKFPVRHLQGMSPPDDWGDPDENGKITRMLSYMHKFTFEDQLTWWQIGGIAGSVALGGWALDGDVPVYVVGFGDIFFDRLGYLSWDTEVHANILSAYVGITFGIDRLARLPLIAKNLFAPSTTEFCVSRGSKALYAGLLFGGLTTALIQLFYLVDAEETYIKNAAKYGIGPGMFLREIYIFGFPYFVEGFVWGVDISMDLVNRMGQRFGWGVPRPVLSTEISSFRGETLASIAGLKEVIYFLPDEYVRDLYDNIFDGEVYSTLKAKSSDASDEDLNGMVTLLRIKYLLSMAKDLGVDHASKNHRASILSYIVDGISIGGPIVSIPFRYLALQVIFTLMAKEFSFGLVSEATAEYVGYGLAAIMSVPKAFVELATNLGFFNEFVPYWTGEAHGDTAIKGWRISAQAYATLESVWNLIPLLALCLDTTDKFFDSNMQWMWLAVPFLFSEFTASTVTLLESYVKVIPTTANRLYNKARRKCGVGNTVGYMRDELVDMIERHEKLFKGFDGNSLAFFKTQVVDAKWDNDE